MAFGLVDFGILTAEEEVAIGREVVARRMLLGGERHVPPLRTIVMAERKRHPRRTVSFESLMLMCQRGSTRSRVAGLGAGSSTQQPKSSLTAGNGEQGGVTEMNTG